LLNAVAGELDRMSITQPRDKAAAALLHFASELPPVSVSLVGMSTVDHVDANASALALDVAGDISQVVRDLYPQRLGTGADRETMH
jgi:aryl-alcohol dehydrogenase-like predicted oxidoreductase